MRFSWPVLLLMPAALLLGLYTSARFPAVNGVIRQYLPEIKLNKQVNISGLNLLKPSQLALAEFSDKSLLWWFWNRDLIETKLLENTWLESARLESCGVFRPSCINLDLKERVPSAVVSVNSSTWIVGRDGGFIRPISQKLDVALPILEGFTDSAEFSGNLRARLKYALDALESIQATSKLKVLKLKLEGNGELKLHFDNVEPMVTFGLAGEDSESLERQARRLNVVLSSLGRTGSNAAEIDLAFNNLAVVKPLN